MSTKRTLFVVTVVCCLYSTATLKAVTVQDPGNVLADGSAYLWVEGEDYLEGANGPAVGFVRVDNVNPIKTIEFVGDPPEPVVKGGLDVLPADTNASGGTAIMASLEASGTATWEVQFAIPATYYLYLHWSMYNRDLTTNYGNEDSFYVPPAFNKNTREDWIGFDGVDQFGEPKLGDTALDGYIDGFPMIAQNYMSEGVLETHNSTDEDFYDGQFHWFWISKANEMNEDGSWVSFDGHGIRYDVTEEMVGAPLEFQISSREPYGVIDGLLFSTSPELLFDNSQEQMDGYFLSVGGGGTGDFNANGALDGADIDDLTGQVAGGAHPPAYDLNGDALVDGGDIGVWVTDLYNSWIGDANLDGEFNSGDLVDVLASGTYEMDVDSVWTTGDFNGDGRTNSSDLVAALAGGGYEQGPRGGVQAVPEPSGLILLAVGALLLGAARRPFSPPTC
jgi:hypothetical protein